jgi:hypothetical protein
MPSSGHQRSLENIACIVKTVAETCSIREGADD